MGRAGCARHGGVIQTEATVRYLLAGKNPYVEDYVATPMADWGFSRFAALTMPWFFVFSAPFYAGGQLAGFSSHS